MPSSAGSGSGTRARGPLTGEYPGARATGTRKLSPPSGLVKIFSFKMLQLDDFKNEMFSKSISLFFW